MLGNSINSIEPSRRKLEIEKILRDLESNLSDGCKAFLDQTRNLVLKQTNLESFSEESGNAFEATKEYIEFAVLRRFFPIMRDIKIAESFIASNGLITDHKKLFLVNGLAKFKYFKAFYDIITYFGCAILMQRDPSYMPPEMFCDLIIDVCEASIRNDPNFEKDKRAIIQVFLINLGLESLSEYRFYVDRIKYLKANGGIKASFLESKVFDLACLFKYDLDDIKQCTHKGLLTEEEFSTFEANYFSEIEDVVTDWFDDVGSRFVIFKLLERASNLVEEMSVVIPEGHIFENLASKKEEYSEAISNLMDIKQVHEMALLVNNRVSECFRRGDNINGIMSSTLQYIRNWLKGEDWKYISGFIALDAIFISACRELLKDGNQIYKREEIFDFFNKSLEFYDDFFKNLKEGRFVCQNLAVNEYLHLPLVSGLSKAAAVSRFRTTFRPNNYSLQGRIEDLEIGISAYGLLRDVMNYFANKKRKYEIETFADVHEDPEYKILLIFTSAKVDYLRDKKKEWVSSLSSKFHQYIDLMRSELAKLRKELLRRDKADAEQAKQKAEALANYEKGFEDIIKVFEDSTTKTDERVKEQMNRISNSSFTPKKENRIIEMVVESARKLESREQNFQDRYEEFFYFIRMELSEFKTSFTNILRDEKVKLGKDSKRYFVPFLGSFNCDALMDEVFLFNSKLENLVSKIEESIEDHQNSYQKCKALHLKILKADLYLICGLSMISLHERAKGIEFLKKSVDIVKQAEADYNKELELGGFSSSDDVPSLYAKISMCKASVIGSHNSAVVEHREFLAKLEVYREKAKQKLGDRWQESKKEISPEAKFFREMRRLQDELLNIQANRLLNTEPIKPAIYICPIEKATVANHAKTNFANMSFDDMALLKPKTFKPTHTKAFEPYGKEEILKRFEAKESANGFVRQ